MPTNSEIIVKTHLNFGGRYACGVEAEVFSKPPEEWLKEHPSLRCGRCELSQIGQKFILDLWKTEARTAEQANAGEP